jgi:isopenicillin-N epimerase
MKISRRNILKSLGLGTMALTTLPSWGKHDHSHLPPIPAIDDPQYWQKVRDQYALAKDSVFFNPGTVGAMPRVVVNRMVEHLRYIAEDVADWAYKDDNKEEFISGYNNLMGVRTKVAIMVNATAPEIAMTDNVTSGMSYIANGITLQPGDEVLTTDQEHSGGKGGWLVKEKRGGVVFRTVAVPKPAHSSSEVYDILVKGINPRTKVLMVSHMITGSGAILPVKELCAEAAKRGIFTVVDGAQTIGQIKVDVKEIGCDVYLGCFHKWVGAPAGTGFMYIKADRMKDIWTTVASTRWDNHEDEGFRFTQRGTGNFPVLKGLDAALDFYNDIGHERIYARIKFLGERLRTGLRANNKVKIFSPVDESMCAGITVYNVEGLTGSKLQEEFWTRAKMRPRSQGDQFGVRHCTHIFNSPEEIDKAIALVNSL